MSSRTEAPVTPSVMKWARERARLDVDQAAARIGRPKDDIIAWETGAKRPSLAQLRKASQVYKRSLAVFFLSVPPTDFDTLRDFRQLPEGFSSEYSPELAFLIRQVQVRQEWMKEYIHEEGEGPLPFIGVARLTGKPDIIAQSIRETLGVPPDEQIRRRSEREALNLWIERAEDQRIFVCRQGIVDPGEARGFVLSDRLAPFVFLNSSDALRAQLFTLVHEIAHLWLDQSGISNLIISETAHGGDSLQIERHCNRVAAETLVEKGRFVWELNRVKGSLEERIHKLARTFWVSEEVIARRLLEGDIIPRSEYLRLREEYQRRWREHQGKTTKGGPTYYTKTVVKNGRRFTRTVINAFYSDRVSGREASSLLDAKIGHFPRLSEDAGGPLFIGRREAK